MFKENMHYKKLKSAEKMLFEEKVLFKFKSKYSAVEISKFCMKKLE